MAKHSWRDLYKLLRELRMKIAKDNEMPPWWCSNKLLHEIARCRPSTVGRFLLIEGIKPRHKKFAEPIVNLIAQYCRENRLDTDMVQQIRRTNLEKRQKYQKQLRETAGSLDGVDMGLYRKLQNLRSELCHGYRARSRIFHNFAIRDMARRRPSNKENFLKVYGVGQKKLDQFGDLFINTINEYCTTHSLEMDVDSKQD